MVRALEFGRFDRTLGNAGLTESKTTLQTGIELHELGVLVGQGDEELGWSVVAGRH